jgi:hypothetical protein
VISAQMAGRWFCAASRPGSWRAGQQAATPTPSSSSAAEAVMGDQLARWLGVALLTLNAVNQRFFITTYPL